MKIDTKKSGCCCNSSTGRCSGGCGKLETFDYLSSLPVGCAVEDYVEVQFKNTRKGFYLNNLHLPLYKGDIVAVEASPGHDIGTVTLTGKMVELQMRRCNYHIPVDSEPKKIYRLAKPVDIEKYEESKSLEEPTMIQSRQIAKDLGLDMKIGDVEYQGDGQKAIFYYIADQRVDFRQLIKKLAEAFHIRVEMKQIGARQEAGRIGGLGPCGRQLCCSGWISSFVSVGTNAARIQDLSLNPQKLAGQCAKLKCCLNYEVDTYYEAQHKLPSREIELRTQKGSYRLLKTDILSGMMTYIPNEPKASLDDVVTIHSSRVFEIIRQNRNGNEPFSPLHDSEDDAPIAQGRRSKDILSDESLTRFDSPKEGRNRRRKGRKNNGEDRILSSDVRPTQTRRGNAELVIGSNGTQDARSQHDSRRTRRERGQEGNGFTKTFTNSSERVNHKDMVSERVKANAEVGTQRRRQPRKKPVHLPNNKNRSDREERPNNGADS